MLGRALACNAKASFRAKPRARAAQCGADLADGLGGTSGRRDDVAVDGAAAAPVLLGGAIHRLLGGGRGVDGGHKALLDAKLLVDDLREAAAKRETKGKGRNMHSTAYVPALQTGSGTSPRQRGSAKQQAHPELQEAAR